jgi:hypothetical protein
MVLWLPYYASLVIKNSTNALHQPSVVGRNVNKNGVIFQVALASLRAVPQASGHDAGEEESRFGVCGPSHGREEPASAVSFTGTRTCNKMCR